MQTNPSQTIPNYRFDSSRTYDVKTSPSNSVPIDHFYELKESHWKLEREKVMLTEANRQTEEKLKSLQEKLIKIEQDFHQTLNENTELKSKCSDKNIDTILRENERLKSKYDRQKEEIKSLANRIPNEMKRTFLNNNSNANDENSRPRGNGYDYYTDNTMNDMTLNVTMEACQMCWNALIKWDNVLNTILDGNMFDDLQGEIFSCTTLCCNMSYLIARTSSVRWSFRVNDNLDSLYRIQRSPIISSDSSR
jgi:hypothetical protein